MTIAPSARASEAKPEAGSFKYRLVLKFDGFERVVEGEYPAPVSSIAEPASYTAGRQREAGAKFVRSLINSTSSTVAKEAYGYAADLLSKNTLVAAPSAPIADMVPLGTISECPSCGGDGKLTTTPGQFGPCWRCGGSGRVMAYRETPEQFAGRMEKVKAFTREALAGGEEHGEAPRDFSEPASARASEPLTCETPKTDGAALWLMAEGPLPADWRCPPGQENDIRQFDHHILGPCTEWKVVTAAFARRLERLAAPVSASVLPPELDKALGDAEVWRSAHDQVMATLKNMAARTRPAVKAYLLTREQAVLKCKDGTFAPHYRKTMEHEADKARRLLDEIEALIGPMSGPDDPPVPPHHFPVA